MSRCNDCPQLDECAERRQCQRRHGAATRELWGTAAIAVIGVASGIGMLLGWL